jgi:hypothetical protein
VLITLGLYQVEINILTLDQVLVLHIANANTRVMGENILTGVITLSTHCDEPKPRLGIKPLDNSSKTRGLSRHGFLLDRHDSNIHSFDRMYLYGLAE